MTKKSETLILSSEALARYEGGGELSVEDCAPSEPLIERVAAVNGRATKFVTSADAIVELAMDIEEDLIDAGIPKRARVGVTARHRGKGPSAAAYKNAAKATEIGLLRRSSGWVLVDIKEVYVFPKQGAKLDITLTHEQAEIVSRVALRPFKVAPASTDQAVAA